MVTRIIGLFLRATRVPVDQTPGINQKREGAKCRPDYVSIYVHQSHKEGDSYVDGETAPANPKNEKYNGR
jgi:hypothetical protein